MIMNIVACGSPDFGTQTDVGNYEKPPFANRIPERAFQRLNNPIASKAVVVDTCKRKTWYVHACNRVPLRRYND